MAIAEHNRETLVMSDQPLIRLAQCFAYAKHVVSEDKHVREGDVRSDGCVKYHVRSEWEDIYGRPLWVVTEVGPNGRCRDTFVRGYELSDMTLVECDHVDPRD